MSEKIQFKVAYERKKKQREVVATKFHFSF